MSGFLDRMAGASRARLDEARGREPLASLRARARTTPPPPTLRRQGRFDLIAEFKLHSPALGSLGGDATEIADRATTYARAGAAAVSVLTEPTQFHGRLDHLAAAATLLAPLAIPAMRKDFLVDPYQLYEARAAGAGGVLLIVRMLSGDTLAEMLGCAGELGLFVLLEAFEAADIERAAIGIRRGCPLAPRNPDATLGDTHGHLARGAQADGAAPSAAREGEEPGQIPPDRAARLDVLIGVNCRDLQTLAVLPQRFSALAPLLPTDVVRVAESGIVTPDDCADVARAGYEMALVGGALMTAANPEGLIRKMLVAGRAAI